MSDREKTGELMVQTFIEMSAGRNRAEERCCYRIHGVVKSEVGTGYFLAVHGTFKESESEL